MEEKLIYKVRKYFRTVKDHEICLDSKIVYEGTDKSQAEIAFTGGVLEFGESVELYIFDNAGKLIRSYERTR